MYNPPPYLGWIVLLYVKYQWSGPPSDPLPNSKAKRKAPERIEAKSFFASWHSSHTGERCTGVIFVSPGFNSLARLIPSTVTTQRLFYRQGDTSRSILLRSANLEIKGLPNSLRRSVGVRGSPRMEPGFWISTTTKIKVGMGQDMVKRVTIWYGILRRNNPPPPMVQHQEESNQGAYLVSTPNAA